MSGLIHLMQQRKLLMITMIGLMPLVLLFTNFFGNVFLLIIDKKNFIPKQSSILFFEMTELSSGSSEEWVYGEDRSNYYYNPWTKNKEDVIAFPKEDVEKCPSFNKKNFHTWCNTVK